MKSMLITLGSPAQKRQLQTKAFAAERDVTAERRLE
jgi:hypothetical protein